MKNFKILCGIFLLLGLTWASVETEKQIHLIPMTFSELTKSRTWHSAVVTITDEELTINADNFARFTGEFKISGMRPWIQKLEFPKLKKLNLENIGLERLPEEICKMPHLKELHLDTNKLETLPKEIGNLKQLKKLYITFNSLKELPAEIGNLKILEELNLCDNQLTVLPK